MDYKTVSSVCQPHLLIRIAPILVLFLVLSRVSIGADEKIGTLRGVPISGDVLSENEQIDKVPHGVLWARMSFAVYQAEIARLGLEVSDDEFAAENRIIQREVGFTPEMAAKIAERLKANKRALMDWLATPEKDQEIYDRILGPLGTGKKEWELLKQNYNTQEKVAELRVPKGPEDILEAGIGDLREELLKKKLAEHVLDRKIVDDGVRWEAYLKYRNIEPESKKAGEARYFFIRTEVSLALRDWIAQLIEDKKLVIENAEYKDSLVAQAKSILEKSSKDR